MATIMPLAPDLQSKLDHLPDQPGVYLMKSARGEIVYIGKARVLAERVRTYFLKGSDHTPKTSVLIGQVGISKPSSRGPSWKR